jgi:hypothetical protein
VFFACAAGYSDFSFLLSEDERSCILNFGLLEFIYAIVIYSLTWGLAR